MTANQLASFGITIAFVVVIGGSIYFNRFSKRRFDYQFLALKSFVVTSIACCFFVCGLWLKTKVSAHGTYANQGLCLSGVGIFIYLWLALNNIRRTNILVGISGSIVQLVIYLPTFVLGIVPVLVALPLVPIYLWCRRPGSYYTEETVVYRPQYWYPRW